MSSKKRFEESPSSSEDSVKRKELRDKFMEKTVDLLIDCCLIETHLLKHAPNSIRGRIQLVVYWSATG
jgi:hypothetical protein